MPLISNSQCYFTVDTRSIDKVLQKNENLDQHSLAEFCKPAAVKDSEGGVAPRLCAFNVEPEVLVFLPILERLAEGFVFNKLWTDTCNGTQGCGTPIDVINLVSRSS